MQRVKRKSSENDSSNLFRFISVNQGLTAQEISEKLEWTRSKTNRTINVLEKKGWVVRRVFPAAQPRAVAKLEEKTKRLNDKCAKLIVWKDKLQSREKELFAECVSAQMKGDSARATMYANQCAEIRKIMRLVTGAVETLSKLSTPTG